ncbi:MAG: cobyrinate a,c-diamide synthase [Planctomycetaceae bacterium]|jgi:cobyrinic acid a,c-diamide synthase|nr:cobyrinate a,c-diamide synthase [Planctomycetaceae bacterium]
MRILIAGTGSGCGKTTVTCAILSVLKQQNKNVIAFKCGPDYIDPMFHTKVTQVKTHNLDSVLMGENGVRYSLQTRTRDIAVIEGVMGLYDGIGNKSTNSTNYLSQITETPVVLVVDAKGKSLSLCAEIKGFLEFEKNNIVAVILNRITQARYSFYKKMIEDKVGIRVIGFMPEIPEAHIESRHLGLMTANEISDIQNKLALLAEYARKSICFEKLLELAAHAPKLNVSESFLEDQKPCHSVNLYVARDEAFCFYYEDNHQLFESLGGRLHFFSPLRDREIPDDADGLIFWGGYPELYAAQLEKNNCLKNSICQKYKRGLPVYAECGGFMYLQESLTDLQGSRYSMLGMIQGNAQMTDRLQNFGYVKLTANHDNMLCLKGETINAHSFHYSASNNEGGDFTATKISNGDSYPCIVATPRIFAGYPHIHFRGNSKFAEGLIKTCFHYRNELQ